MVLRTTRTAIAVIITCALQSVSISHSAPLKELPGKRAGLFVQCKSGGVQVKTAAKGKYASFKSYQNAEVKKLTKKLKGKPKNVVKASVAELTKSLKALQTNLSKECKTSGPCFNPNKLVLSANGTSSCEANYDSCIMSTIRCTKGVPGSCACDRKPASSDRQSDPQTPSNPGQPTQPTPTPAPDNQDVSVSLSLESVGTFKGYRVFLMDHKASKTGVSISSGLTSISDNGILAGGYFIEQPYNYGGFISSSPKLINGISLHGIGIAPYEEQDFTIVPFLSRNGSFTTPCTLTTCPKGIVLNDVNEFGIATGNSTTYDTVIPAQGAAYLFNGPKAQLTRLTAGTSKSVCVRGLNDLNIALGAADCYQPSESHHAWNDVNASSAPPTQQFDEAGILRLFDVTIKQRMLEMAKADTRAMYPACTDAQINQTVLKEFSQTSPPKVTIVGTNNLGDVLGNIDSLFMAFYENPCMDNWIRDPHSFINFVITKDGRITFLDLTSYIQNDYYSAGFFISDSRIVVAQYPLFGAASRIDTKTSPMRWSSAPFDSYGTDFVRVHGTNARGDAIGVRGFLGKSSEHFILQGNTTISLEALLKEMAPGKDLRVHTVNDINECGEVVGVIGDYDTLEHRGILLSPPGCR